MNAERPVYDWDRARIGDAASAVTVEIKAEDIRRYAAAIKDENPAFAESCSPAEMKVPAFMVRIFAPLRRRELVAEMGNAYLDHSTPAVRWTSQWFTEPRVGDIITSVTRVKDKYERKGRRYLEWEVEAHNQKGELILKFGYVNLWDRGRPEDRNR